MPEKRIAQQDIYRRNHLGQNVMLVAKGQPIPEGVDVKASESAKGKSRSRRSAKKRG